VSSFEELSRHLPKVTDGKKKSLCPIRQKTSQSVLPVCGLRPHTQRNYECCEFWYVSSMSWHRINIQQTCSVFHMVRETSGKFGMHAGNMKFITQN